MLVARYRKPVEFCVSDNNVQDLRAFCLMLVLYSQHCRKIFAYVEVGRNIRCVTDRASAKIKWSRKALDKKDSPERLEDISKQKRTQKETATQLNA